MHMLPMLVLPQAEQQFRRQLVEFFVAIAFFAIRDAVHVQALILSAFVCGIGAEQRADAFRVRAEAAESCPEFPGRR